MPARFDQDDVKQFDAFFVVPWGEPADDRRATVSRSAHAR